MAAGAPLGMAVAAHRRHRRRDLPDHGGAELPHLRLSAMDRFRPSFHSVWLWLLIAGIAVVVFLVAAAPGCRNC